jgi:putative transposase
VQDERYLMVCHRYIELNPMRAGMADALSDYPWSSYRGNALGQQDDLLTPHSLYTRLGADPVARQAAYRHLLSEALSDEALDQIRQAGKGNRPLGSIRD